MDSQLIRVTKKLAYQQYQDLIRMRGGVDFPFHFISAQHV